MKKPAIKSPPTKRTSVKRTPEINAAELWLDRGSRRYTPGDLLTGQFDLTAWQSHDLHAVEITILWYTAGQGEEDFCSHHFERHEFKLGDVTADEKQATKAPDPVEANGKFESVLPASPVSYDGQIVKVCWTVRLRGFFAQSRQRMVEAPFWLTANETSAAEKKSTGKRMTVGGTDAD